MLKLGDAHFRNLAEWYHAVSRAIRRIESEVELCSARHAELLKKQRLSLFDEITAILEIVDERTVFAQE